MACDVVSSAPDVCSSCASRGVKSQLGIEAIPEIDQGKVAGTTPIIPGLRAKKPTDPVHGDDPILKPAKLRKKIIAK
jgi:hypothetical protein